MNAIWDASKEAANLEARFENVKQSEFARLHQVPGGPSMVSQNIKGKRPISLEAAVAYASGFNCSLDDISPRLAALVRQAAPLLKTSVDGSYKTNERPLKSRKARSTVEYLTILAESSTLLDSDWMLIDQIAERFASNTQRQADPQDLPLQVTAPAQETIDNRVREAQEKREQEQQQGRKPTKNRAA